MRGRGRSSLGVIALLALLALTPAMAKAVSPAAEALFEEGRRLMAAGQTTEACVRFAESNAIDASSGKLLNLALCHETLGKTATAWAEYRAAARLARNEGQDGRAAAADGKAAGLAPKLPRLTIIASSPPIGLVIATEEGSFDVGGMGVPVPIDPGIHRVTATAPGRRRWTATLELADGEQRTLEIPTLAEEPKAPPSAAPSVPAAMPAPLIARLELPLALTAPAPKPLDQPLHSHFELYTLGAGATLVVAGSVLYGIAYARFDAAKSACNQGDSCPDHDSRVSTIQTLEYLGIGSWVAGGGLLLTGGLHHWFRRTKTPFLVGIDPVHDALSLSAVF